MGLESGSYVADLVVTNPEAADVVSQGDDHLRLIKTALDNTFPNAGKAFRFPTVAAIATATVNISFPTDHNKLFPVDADAGSIVVNLPDPTAGGTVHEDGFTVIVMRVGSTTGAANLVTITPSGAHTINAAATLILRNPNRGAILIWSAEDTQWLALTTLNTSESNPGVAELATTAEVQALVDISRIVTPAGLAALTPDDTRLGLVEKATVAEVRSATSNKGITADLIESAAAYVTLTDAATVALNWDNFINGVVTLTANRILGNPTNGQPGTVRTVRVLGSDGTDRTLTFDTQYKGDVPTLTDIDNAKAYELVIKCITATHFCIAGYYSSGV